MIYKDKTGNLHDDMGGTARHLFPKNMEPYTRIDDKEVAANLPPPTAEQVRATRNALMVACDWTQSSDVPKATQTKWKSYRQSLRDIPTQQGFPADVVWPVSP